MNLRAPAILVASRHHGETASIARFLTEDFGLVAAYVAGGRGRQLRPVMIPGNRVAIDLRAKSDSQLPFAKVELTDSRGPWMTEPLPAAAITWACALTATALPERNAYPALFGALDGLLRTVLRLPAQGLERSNIRHGIHHFAGTVGTRPKLQFGRGCRQSFDVFH